jgi:hypothetical protein
LFLEAGNDGNDGNDEERIMVKSTTVTFGTPRTFWTEHREAALNWLALGLLLAAWNATGNDSTPSARRRPDSLRGYTCVSLRAAHRSVELDPMNAVER